MALQMTRAAVNSAVTTPKHLGNPIFRGITQAVPDDENARACGA